MYLFWTCLLCFVGRAFSLLLGRPAVCIAMVVACVRNVLMCFAAVCMASSRFWSTLPSMPLTRFMGFCRVALSIPKSMLSVMADLVVGDGLNREVNVGVLCKCG